MPTYVYETVPSRAGGPIRRFEVKQSMNDAPLDRDPVSGERVRRVISGGFAPLLSGGTNEAGCDAGACAVPAAPSHGCGPMCGCVGSN
ncbi:MAG TPA: hypothetical protein DCE44_25300 [Verrucomicrobiales bacterium]|nr:hypothetical protein [Verrucomicrobiales bacterium]